jgi:hypothetical protein
LNESRANEIRVRTSLHLRPISVDGVGAHSMPAEAT